MKKLICLLFLIVGINSHAQWTPPLAAFERDYWVIPSDINSVKELATLLKVNSSLFEIGEYVKISKPIVFPDDFKGKRIINFSFKYPVNETTVSALGYDHYVNLYSNIGTLNQSWPWTLSTNRSWIVLSKKNGLFLSFNQNIDIVINRNYSGAPRTGKIFLNINGQTLELEIEQD